jgi:hypothetical protein
MATVTDATFQALNRFFQCLPAGVLWEKAANSWVQPTRAAVTGFEQERHF